MIQVAIRYFNILSDYAGKKEEKIILPEGCTLRELVLMLVDQNQPAFGNIVLSEGEVSSFIRVFINDNMITAESFDQVMNDGDRVLLFPAVSGG
jgi:MoaD family protein